MSYVSSIELRKVRPEAIHEKSVIESAVDLFHEVVEKVPQAYNISARSTNTDQLEPIEWIRFLSNAYQWHSSIRPDTLVLFIAYKSGLTLWTIEPNGIANELFSIREHNICSACLLTINTTKSNSTSAHLPLLAIAKSAGPPSIQIRSLKNDQHSIKVIELPGTGSQTEPLAIEANESVLVCATNSFIVGYDILNFTEKFFITSCYSPLPFTLSSRWLSFADYRLYSIHQSLGGINSNISEQNLSYTGAVLNVAKSFSKSVAKLSESVFGFGSNGAVTSSTNLSDKTNNTSRALSTGNLASNGSNSITNTNAIAHTGSGRQRIGSCKDEPQPGIITIVDIVKLFGSCVHDEKQNWIIAHFQAHIEPIGHLQFNPDGHLLVTCDTSGHSFNVLEIQASPYRCTRTFVKHLYTLFRGDTDCRVSHMTFSQDSRWLSVSTKRGTTHIFALHPYGGVVNVRTHTTTHVTNKPSCQRSAAFDESNTRLPSTVQYENVVRDQSIGMPTDGSSNGINGHSNQSNSKRGKRSHNNCLFLSSVTLIRQPTESFVSGLSSPFNIEAICLASTFGISRGFLNPEHMITHHDYVPKACSSLFIISWHGRMIEYMLEPMPDTSKYGTRVTPETPIILKALPKAQWALQRSLTWPEIRMSTGYAFLSQTPNGTSGNKNNSKDDWLRQVEMNTHVAPHRRLWMGPQFKFKHYSDATVSVCHPNSNVFTADSPQTSMNFVDAELNSLPIEHSRTIPLHVPDQNKDVAPAYIEFGSGSFQDAPALSLYGSSFDSLKSDFEVELMEKLADAAIDIPLKNNGNSDTADSLSSSSCSGTVIRPLLANNLSEHMMPFIDNVEPTD